jgi:hypothetical protein
LFALQDGATLSTTGSLVNDEFVALDSGMVGGGGGGSSLAVAGTLTNSGDVLIGNPTLSAADKVTAASLDNTGYIYLQGSTTSHALLQVTAGAAGFGTAGVLSGSVELDLDSAIEFASGQITSLASGSGLTLIGNDAFIEDSTALGSNSALTELTSIGAGALFLLQDGATLSTTGALVNDGTVELDNGYGGSHLTVAGTLTNTGTLNIGTKLFLTASDSVTAKTFVNSGTVDLTGKGTNLAPSTCRERRPTTAPFRSSPTPRSSLERSAARGPSASTTPIFGSTRASRPGRPSARAARTR